MLTCKKISRLTDAYLDGALSDTRRAAFETHLEGCAHCRHEVELHREMRLALKNMPAPAVPNGLHRSIMARVYEAEKTAARKPFYLHYQVYTPVLAAIVLVFLFRFSVYDRYLETRHPMPHPVPSPAHTALSANLPDSGAMNNAAQDVLPDRTHPEVETPPRFADGIAQKPQESTSGSGSRAVTPAPTSRPAQDSNAMDAVPDNPSASLPAESEPAAPIAGQDEEKTDHAAPSDDVPVPGAPGVVPRTTGLYTVDDEQYDIHLLTVKEEAAKKMETFRVGEVTPEYYEEVKSRLPQEGYTEETVLATEASQGERYVIHVELAAPEEDSEEISTEDSLAEQPEEQPTEPTQ